MCIHIYCIDNLLWFMVLYLFCFIPHHVYTQNKVAAALVLWPPGTEKNAVKKYMKLYAKYCRPIRLMCLLCLVCVICSDTSQTGKEHTEIIKLMFAYSIKHIYLSIVSTFHATTGTCLNHRVLPMDSCVREFGRHLFNNDLSHILLPEPMPSIGCVWTTLRVTESKLDH